MAYPGEKLGGEIGQGLGQPERLYMVGNGDGWLDLFGCNVEE